MKNLTFLVALLLLPILSFAHSDKITHNGDENSSESKDNIGIRSLKKVALTFDGGWNTIGANGIMASYYPNPRIGVDLGVGIGLKGPKLGVRGKYMFSLGRFSPFVGLGISGRFWNQDDVEQVQESADINGGILVETLTYDINNAIYVQPTVGFEYMSNKGFVFGMATGYSIAANEPYEVISGDSSAIESGLKAVWGNGIILSMNIGYAF